MPQPALEEVPQALLVGTAFSLLSPAWGTGTVLGTGLWLSQQSISSLRSWVVGALGKQGCSLYPEQLPQLAERMRGTLRGRMAMWVEAQTCSQMASGCSSPPLALASQPFRPHLKTGTMKVPPS